MGIYVDAEDIRQHMRGGNALSVEALEELMAEQEYFVQTTLNLNELPPDNPILTSIIRDLTIAAAIYSLTAPNSDDLGKADTLRRDANNRLTTVDRIGLGHLDTASAPHDAAAEVVNAAPNSFFSLGDFDRFNQLAYDSASPTIFIIRERTTQDDYR